MQIITPGRDTCFDRRKEVIDTIRAITAPIGYTV